uniref:CYCLIN domain-containing protein n=1 Tax=Parastrongyloides trichosuri TaxID=131310 RepID=A0A0N4ZVG5_PARTI
MNVNLDNSIDIFKDSFDTMYTERSVISQNKENCNNKYLTSKRIACMVMLEIRNRINQSKRINSYKMRNSYLCYAIDHFCKFIKEHGTEVFDIKAVATISLYYVMKQKINRVEMIDFIYMFLMIRHPDVTFGSDTWRDLTASARELFNLIENVMIKTIGLNYEIIDINTPGFLFFLLTKELNLPEKIFLRSCLIFGDILYYTNLQEKFDQITIAATSIELAMKHKNEGETNFEQFKEILLNTNNRLLKPFLSNDKLYTILIKECTKDFLNTMEGLRYDKEFVTFAIKRLEYMNSHKIIMDFLFISKK